MSESRPVRLCHGSICVLQCATVCGSVLQCVAACCRVLQCVAACCSVSQCVAALCLRVRPTLPCSPASYDAASQHNTLQHITTGCNKLQHTAQHTATHIHRSVLLCSPTPYDTAQHLQHTATRCNTLQHAATQCSTHCATHCNNMHNTLQHTFAEAACNVQYFESG